LKATAAKYRIAMVCVIPSAKQRPHSFIFFCLCNDRKSDKALIESLAAIIVVGILAVEDTKQDPQVLGHVTLLKKKKR
jgi:hypothetical protein